MGTGEEFVTRDHCHGHIDEMKREMRLLREDVHNISNEVHSAWEELRKVLNTIFVSNEKKSLVDRVRTIENSTLAPRYADLSWVQIAKIAVVRSTWAVAFLVVGVSYSPVGQRILTKMLVAWFSRGQA